LPHLIDVLYLIALKLPLQTHCHQSSVIADLPLVIYAHSSVIILLGCLLGLGHLAATSQLIVVKSGGISIMQIAQKVMVVALLFMLITILLGEFIAPVTTKYAESYRFKALGPINNLTR
jgi:lipopolysaccharide export system permease protein